MPEAIPDAWHNFFSLVGSAAATLVGLMFVAASVGTGVFTEERQVGLRTFLSPTVVAFSSVLAACIIGVLPLRSASALALLLGGLGALGIGYSVVVWRQMVRNGITAKIDHVDRVWYAFAPILAYAILVAAAVAFAKAQDFAPSLLAAGVCVLLLAGIRNAWDMTTWVVLERRD